MSLQLLHNTTQLNTLNEELISPQEEHKELNRKLRTLITRLDDQMVAAFKAKEVQKKDSYEYSIIIIIVLIAFAIVLLVIGGI